MPHGILEQPLIWAGFLAFVLAMLALDLGVFHRTPHAMRMREAATWSAVWIALSGGFALLVRAWLGPQAALEFTTAYLIEKALSVDNVFVFLALFGSFAVPAALQHRVLFWGVLGALILRGVFILAGAAALEAFHGVMFVFAALLLVTGFKLLRHGVQDERPERNPIFRMFQRIVPSTSQYHGAAFFVRESGKRLATPLFMVLVLVELTDVLFAVDSIPAVFAVTRDPFLVFTSNVFAILGLRSLFFCMAGLLGRLRHLRTGLAVVLLFVGAKIGVAQWYTVPVLVSLAAIAGILMVAVVASLLDRRPAAAPAAKLAGRSEAA
jgi:tellurite resistance protein TerC